MKTIVFLSVFFLFIIQSYGQLNPIDNLNWNHWYESPYNCYEINWEIPDTSYNDTLIGYNIYVDDTLFDFTTDNYYYCSYSCISGYPDTSGCNNIWIFCPSYVYVVAVYNSTNIESNYTDSVYCDGTYMSNKEISYNEIKIYPNPTKGKIIIRPNDIKKIMVLNEFGRLLFEKYDESEIDLSLYSKGMYIVKILTDTEVIIKKVMLN